VSLERRGEFWLLNEVQREFHQAELARNPIQFGRLEPPLMTVADIKKSAAEDLARTRQLDEDFRKDCDIPRTMLMSGILDSVDRQTRFRSGDRPLKAPRRTKGNILREVV
jgi:hypothetical protein